MDTVAVVPKSKMSHGKINWKSGPAIKQYFPFHDNLIHYISMNPTSSKAYNKMIQACKFFFERNPILVAAQMHEPCTYQNSGYTSICPKHDLPPNSSLNNDIEIDLTKISSKFWLTSSLSICKSDIPNFTSVLFRKIYRCEIADLFLSNVTLTFNEFKFLVQYVQTLFICLNVTLVENDENTVMLDKILEVCPKIEKFYHSAIDSTMLAATTLKDISKLQNLTNLKNFDLYHILEDFDIQDVSDFLIKNFLDTSMMFLFDEGISEEYKSQLEAIREKIFELKIENHLLIID